MFNFTRNQLVAAYVVIAFALVGTGLLVARSGVLGAKSGQVKLIQAGAKKSTGSETAAGPEEAAKPAEICVHVAGQVNKPGLYNLEPGSRIMDAIKAAGGASSNADLESINLAEKVEDGQQIYIAEKGKIPPPRTSVVRGGAESKPKTAARSGEEKKSGPEKLTKPGQGTVNVNSAGLDDLQRLPGIGPAMAQRILDYRSEHGRFQSVDELDEVKGIGPKKLEKLKPFVSL